VAKEEESGIILRLSDEIGITPVLVARFVLEAYLKQVQEELQQDEEDDEGGGPLMEGNEVVDDPRLIHNRNRVTYNFSNIRSEVTRLLRNTCIIEDKNLAYEVHLVRFLSVASQ
jgi:hypothetical protein